MVRSKIELGVMMEKVSWCVSLSLSLFVFLENERDGEEHSRAGVIMEKVSWSLSCTVGTRH